MKNVQSPTDTESDRGESYVQFLDDSDPERL